MCRICFEPINPGSWLHLSIAKPTLCSKCYKEFHPIFLEFHFEGVQGLAIYPYDATIKERLFQLKGCYDIELSPVFLNYFAKELHGKFKNYWLVPAPSWVDDDRQREFNHVEEIFKILKLPMLKVLVKTENVKQADLNVEKRQEIRKKIRLIEDDKVRGKNILFVDDVFTTGSTAKTAVSLLRQAGAKKIQILIMSKTRKPDSKKGKNKTCFSDMNSLE